MNYRAGTDHKALWHPGCLRAKRQCHHGLLTLTFSSSTQLYPPPSEKKVEKRGLKHHVMILALKVSGVTVLCVWFMQHVLRQIKRQKSQFNATYKKLFYSIFTPSRKKNIFDDEIGSEGYSWLSGTAFRHCFCTELPSSRVTVSASGLANWSWEPQDYLILWALRPAILRSTTAQSNSQCEKIEVVTSRVCEA